MSLEDDIEGMLRRRSSSGLVASVIDFHPGFDYLDEAMAMVRSATQIRFIERRLTLTIDVGDGDPWLCQFPEKASQCLTLERLAS